MNIWSIFKKKKFQASKIRLLNGNFQEYFIDPNPKVKGAEVRANNKIYVENNFPDFSRKEQLAVIYHERGHSNFKLLKWIKIIQSMLFVTSIIFLMMIPSYFLISFFTNGLFDIYFIFGGIFSLLFVIQFVSFILFNWLIEIIADLNSIKNIDKKVLISKLKDLYRKKDIGFWRRYIDHPPINLRIKIMEAFD